MSLLWKVASVHIRIDVIPGPSVDRRPMLSIRDNGGGMGRSALHRMLSFGVSSSSNKRIGRYGNGFKSSSMRLGVCHHHYSSCPPETQLPV